VTTMNGNINIDDTIAGLISVIFG